MHVPILAQIISGSLADGFFARVESGIALDQLKAGKFVTIDGGALRFFALVTDIKLETTNPDILLFPPQVEEQLLMSLVRRKQLYASIHVRPMLALDVRGRIAPVKTIPLHFAPVSATSKADVALIFGDESVPGMRYFCIGSPLDMHDVQLCLDLDRLVERSNGIFGKTGTGKTFLTRLVLAGLIKTDKAVNLIFDMHGEYGLQARTERVGGGFVKGLKTLFPEKVVIFSIDPAATRRRGCNPDVVIQMPYQAVRVDDVLSLQQELNLHVTALEAGYLIAARHGADWLAVLLEQGPRLKEFAADIGAHPESVAALYRKLKRIEQLPFLRSAQAGENQRDGVVEQMLEYMDRGMSVVVEFGNHTSSFCYLLLANIITRRVHDWYVKKTEKFLGSQRAADEPRKLMITIEEAHKFLNPQTAAQTIFGAIAREMRKYYVSLLVVDQRPSGIDPEVLSQIGTKIVAQLNDEKDIAAVLTGVGSNNQLRAILASLDSRKQALLFGHALAMPVVVQTREYDETFYQSLNLPGGAPLSLAGEREKLINEIF